MKCADVVEQLPAYSDGLMQDSEAAEVQAHLTDCDSCRRKLEAMEVRQSRITEALRQPVEVPDNTDSVMARLPIQRRSRLRWAYAVAIPIAILAVVLFLNRGQKPEYQATKRPAPVSPAPVEKPIPRPMPNPQRFVVQEPQEKRPAVRRHRFTPKHVAKSPEPKPVDSQPTPVSDEFAVLKQAIVQTALEQIRPVTHTLPPNEDAETIERPALEVIANCGPIQVPVEELGG